MQVTEQPRQPRYKIIVYDKPKCPVHGVPMNVGSTSPVKRYCYCPVPGCGQSCAIGKSREERS